MDRVAPPPSSTPPAAPPGQRQAWVFGANGLLGRQLLEVLVEAPEYARVTAVTRRPLGREHPRLANRIVAFERLDTQLAGLPCHDVFCALGVGLGTLALLGVTAVTELAQRWLPARVPDTTDLVVMVLAAILVRIAQRPSAYRVE